jgi:hypothetical protein
MNHRCYRCGWSFSLGRETIEAAVANAGTDKTYNLPCPRCRQINKIPIQQLKRTLPPGWAPAAPPDTAAAEMPAAPAAVSADLATEDAPASAPVAAAEPTENEAPEPAASPAAKKAAPKKTPSTKKASATKKSTSKKAAAKKSAR